MEDGADHPQIIECEIRLHSERPAPSKDSTGELTCADWFRTAVGHPVTFHALAITAGNAWNGPLPPGAQIAAPTMLGDPYWTVFLPAARGVPILAGRIGRPLNVGETFTLPPGQPGVWRDDVVFEGAIVVG